MDNKYGFGEHPPYSLYKSENGKWGLIDGIGNKLQADFDRFDEYTFSCVPWEVVVFNENEGFELQAWYDPCEVWFNFTWDNPAYPNEFGGFLWKKSKKEITKYSQILFSQLSEENHWLIEAIIQNEILGNNFSEDEYDNWIKDLIKSHPEVKVVSITNTMIYPIMHGKLDSDLKCALWRAKVRLDYDIRDYMEEDDTNL